jgi:hypothetical protein
MADKRQLLLADEFLASRREFIVDTNTESRVRSRVLSARRFVLDWQATERAASIMNDIPELLIREQQFARAPYPVTWIEFPFEPWWQALTGKEPLFDADTQIGYLVDNDNVYVISGSAVEKCPALMPLYYQLHHPWPMQDQLDFTALAGISRIGLDGFLWGESIYKLMANKDRPEEFKPLHEQQQRILRDNHSCNVLPLGPKGIQVGRKQIIQRMVNASAGELRNIIGLLLLMNRPSVTEYVRDVGRHRGFVRGKLRPYLSHTVVTIKLDAKQILRQVSAQGEAAEKRRHEVRGIYCHDEEYRKGTKAGCIHEWTEHPDYIDEALDEKRWHTNQRGETEFDNWQCVHCHGHRWWRDNHERGNAAIGYVNKTYQITT